MRDLVKFAAVHIAASLASVKENGSDAPHFSEEEIVRRSRSIARKLTSALEDDEDGVSDSLLSNPPPAIPNETDPPYPAPGARVSPPSAELPDDGEPASSVPATNAASSPTRYPSRIGDRFPKTEKVLPDAPVDGGASTGDTELVKDAQTTELAGNPVALPEGSAPVG